MREWTHTLPSEFPLWKLKFWWIPKSSEGNCRGQNSLDWKYPYIIEKILEHRCLKWVCMTDLRYLKHKLWPKERSGVKLGIWLMTTKSQKSPWFTCLQVAWHIIKIFLTRDTTLLETSFQSEAYIKSYRLSKSREFQFQKFWESQLGSLGTKWHLGARLVAMHRKYYKGEGGGFPQVQAMGSLVSLVSLCLLVACPCIKSAPTTH